jgi:hypothetical protein
MTLPGVILYDPAAMAGSQTKIVQQLFANDLSQTGTFGLRCFGTQAALC